MKKHFLKIATSCLVILSVISCERDDQEVNDSETLVTENSIIEIIDFSDPGDNEPVTDRQLLSLIQDLDIDIAAVTKGDFHFPDGTTEERIFIGGDISYTMDELMKLRDQFLSNDKQYRTFNLVTGSNRNIDIIGYTGNDAFGLSNKERTALQAAVANYNRLNTALTFNLTFGTNWQSKDMVVYDNSSGFPDRTGGMAEFPTSNGVPGKFIELYNLDNFTIDVNEHVITHEIGHCVGFRHSDWFDRLSCPVSSQNNEGQQNTGLGAVQIPGTPSGRDLTSIMQACFPTNSDGEFNNNDITALEFMYPTSTTSSSPCDGVPQWQSTVSYSTGARVVYQGNLYERTNTGWRFIQAC